MRIKLRKTDLASFDNFFQPGDVRMMPDSLDGRAGLRRRRLIGSALATLLLSSCGPDLPPLPTTPTGPYRLGIGDEVRVITFGESQLTGQFAVNDSGYIAVPLLGLVPARGLTTAQLENRIATLLRRGNLIKNPSVSVEVTAYRPVFILGEVEKPGRYPYEPGMTVLTAVAIAGGFTYRAVKGHVRILRTNGGPAVEGVAPRNTYLEPGDVITVLERTF